MDPNNTGRVTEKSQSAEAKPLSPEQSELISNARHKIEFQQKMPDSGAYSVRDLQEALLKAKEAGADVSDLEAQMPELIKSMLRAEAERKIQHQQQIPNSSAYSVRNLQETLRKAKEAGVDVSDLEAQMPELIKSMSEAEKIETAQNVRGSLADLSLPPKSIQRSPNTPKKAVRENAAPHIIRRADELLKLFSSYMGPQASYMMDDLVALAAGKERDGRDSRLDPGHTLASIKREHYAEFTVNKDFDTLLSILGEENGELKRIIESTREFLSEEDED